MNNWHGITLQENFTYSKALGTGALVQATSEYTVNDPFNLNNGYGSQSLRSQVRIQYLRHDHGSLV